MLTFHYDVLSKVCTLTQLHETYMIGATITVIYGKHDDADSSGLVEVGVLGVDDRTDGRTGGQADRRQGVVE